ncbi:UTP--glucose-1-phosphate uridylyltransferase [hydrothermal vent metagenome]|uniref:UTP--glucose-1-phosphate uridylyltransferase n=1 Tax=hydrothermal vent metagenome TaxID=652676 RepID=A0A1W1C771_9ZZZZ
MIKKCLYPVAGSGTRFLPVTKSIAKEMLPILETPLLQYAVEEAISANIKTQVMVLNQQKESIKDYFSAKPNLEETLSADKKLLLNNINSIIKKCGFSYTYQKKPKGLGDAIKEGEELINGDDFAVILPDDLCVNDNESVLQQMIEVYNKYHCSIVAIEEVPMDKVHQYGVISGIEVEKNVFKIDDMIEKPNSEEAPTNLAIIGRYILTNDIFEIIKKTPAGKGGEVQITDALLTQAKQGKVLAYKFKGKRYDCGSIDGFVEATNHFYNK